MDGHAFPFIRGRFFRGEQKRFVGAKRFLGVQLLAMLNLLDNALRVHPVCYGSYFDHFHPFLWQDEDDFFADVEAQRALGFHLNRDEMMIRIDEHRRRFGGGGLDRQILSIPSHVSTLPMFSRRRLRGKQSVPGFMVHAGQCRQIIFLYTQIQTKIERQTDIQTEYMQIVRFSNRQASIHLYDKIHRLYHSQVHVVRMSGATVERPGICMFIV